MMGYVNIYHNLATEIENDENTGDDDDDNDDDDDDDDDDDIASSHSYHAYYMNPQLLSSLQKIEQYFCMFDKF